MSVSKRVITETRIDSDEELLKQAFNTAESGIEYYLTTGELNYNAGLGGEANISFTTIGEGTTLSSDGAVISGSPFFFWLVNHDEDNNDEIGSERFSEDINDICVGVGFTGALKVDLFLYNDSTGTYTYSVERFGYNMNNSNTISGYSTVADECIDTPITVDGGMLLLVTPIGGNSNIIVDGGTGIFPKQGEEIVSVGKMEGGVNTKIKVEDRYEVPSFMLEAISAGNEIGG
jgi:hypothetical protein